MQRPPADLWRLASSHPAWSYWSDATVLNDYAMTTTNLSLQSMITPKSLIENVLPSTDLSPALPTPDTLYYVKYVVLLGLIIVTTLHLSIFSFSSHLLDHCKSLSQPICSIVLSVSVLTCFIVSHLHQREKNLGIIFTGVRRSFTNITHNEGPRTLPRGIPLNTGSHFEKSLLSFTL